MLQREIYEEFSDVMIYLVNYAFKSPLNETELLILNGQIVIGAILAGVFNTTVATTWNLRCLADNPDWLDQVRTEIDETVEKYRSSKAEPLNRYFPASFTQSLEDRVSYFENDHKGEHTFHNGRSCSAQKHWWKRPGDWGYWASYTQE
jgi:hypothetical protein